jgi:homocysteine S-methyltransferase
MNEGRLFSGKSLGEKTNFSIGGAFNPNVLHIDKAVKRLEKKVDAGAHYFMTQPVYDIDRIKTIHEAVKELEAPVFIGIMPLVSAGNAEFLHNEVPGIQLTADTRKRMAACGNDSEAAEREGIAIAKELIDETLRYFNGIYLITPFLRYEITAELTKYVQEQTSAGVTEI